MILERIQTRAFVGEFDSAGRIVNAAEHRLAAEYVPGTGWMYVTEKGSFGGFSTIDAALDAGRLALASGLHLPSRSTDD